MAMKCGQILNFYNATQDLSPYFLPIFYIATTSQLGLTPLWAVSRFLARREGRHDRWSQFTPKDPRVTSGQVPHHRLTQLTTLRFVKS